MREFALGAAALIGDAFCAAIARLSGRARPRKARRLRLSPRRMEDRPPAPQNPPASGDRFEGEATCWSILGGVASIEELRIPARDFSGMGPSHAQPRKRWSGADYWMNGKFRHRRVRRRPLAASSTAMGVFLSDDKDGGHANQGDRPVGQDRQGHPAAGARASAAMAARRGDWNWIMDWARA
jgi:hypothetical protein